jgi:UDP-N-acetylmuramate--alanine ligase
MSEFAEAFVDAEVVVVTDIYAAGEAPIPGITSAALSQAIQAQGHPGSSYIAQRSAVAPALLPQLQSGDLVITFGAGDIWQTGEELLRLLTEP